METSKTMKVIRMAKAGVGVKVIGKMCADVFTNNSMGEGMGVNFEMGLNFWSLPTSSHRVVTEPRQFEKRSVKAQVTELWGKRTFLKGGI